MQSEGEAPEPGLTVEGRLDEHNCLSLRCRGTADLSEEDRQSQSQENAQGQEDRQPTLCLC
jgi:hypothetical protein